MAAGLGFKTFTTGEVLTAGDVNGYLMQGINVFTNATARDAAITAPAEGQFAFTKDNNSLWYYDGAAWVASGATGDIEGVTAGVGISGGGTSGTVTVTNSMATAIDAKGDLVPGTGADTFARLPVGANGTVLTADSAETTGIKWAAASSGALTLISSVTFTTVSTVSFATDTFTSSYRNYRVIIEFTDSTANAAISVRKRVSGTDVTAANYNTGGARFLETGGVSQVQTVNGTSWTTGITVNIPYGNFLVLDVVSPNISGGNLYNAISVTGNTNSGAGGTILGWTNSTGALYDSLSFIMASGNFSGKYRVYGYAD
jgi:hypothetical protein